MAGGVDGAPPPWRFAGESHVNVWLHFSLGGVRGGADRHSHYKTECTVYTCIQQTVVSNKM